MFRIKPGTKLTEYITRTDPLMENQKHDQYETFVTGA